MPTHEEWLDWQAHNSEEIDIGAAEFYRELDQILDGQSECAEVVEELRLAFQEAVHRFVFMTFNMRLKDPGALDVFAVKMLNPDMTHDDIVMLLREMGKTGWKNRARSCEKWRSLLDKYPNLEHVIFFDARGGRRQRPTLNDKLLDEYQSFRRVNDRRQPAKRRALYGPRGLYHQLAVKYHVMGADGKPSGGAVQSRITRQLAGVIEGGNNA